MTEQESDSFMNETYHEGTLTVTFENMGSVSIYSEGKSLRALATQADCCINEIFTSLKEERNPYMMINYNPTKAILNVRKK